MKNYMNTRNYYFCKNLIIYTCIVSFLPHSLIYADVYFHNSEIAGFSDVLFFRDVAFLALKVLFTEHAEISC